MKMPEPLKTERLLLRKPRLDDAPAMFDGWVQDPEVTRDLTWHPHHRIGQTQEFLHGCIRAWEGKTRFPSIITRKDKAKLLACNTKGFCENIFFIPISPPPHVIVLYMP
jgi:RimJ/RimL family protein N-acetyltransferase